MLPCMQASLSFSAQSTLSYDRSHVQSSPGCKMYDIMKALPLSGSPPDCASAPSGNPAKEARESNHRAIHPTNKNAQQKPTHVHSATNTCDTPHERQLPRVKTTCCAYAFTSCLLLAAVSPCLANRAPDWRAASQNTPTAASGVPC